MFPCPAFPTGDCTAEAGQLPCPALPAAGDAPRGGPEPELGEDLLAPFAPVDCFLLVLPEKSVKLCSTLGVLTASPGVESSKIHPPLICFQLPLPFSPLPFPLAFPTGVKALFACDVLLAEPVAHSRHGLGAAVAMGPINGLLVEGRLSSGLVMVASFDAAHAATAWSVAGLLA